jgi:hypothetical protein
MDQGGTLVPQATDYLSGVIGGNHLDPSSNPHLGALTKAVTDPIQASLSAQFGRSGRGNSGDAARYISEGMTSGLAAPLFQNYQFGQGQQMQAAQMAPGMQAAGSLPLDQYLERLRSIGGLGQESSGTSTTKTTPSMGQNLMNAGMMGLGLAGGMPMMGPLGLAGGAGSLFGAMGPNPFGMNVGLNPWQSQVSVA